VADIVAMLMEWGLYGLLVATFTEAFISPILPDIILIPLMLAKPQDALYLGAITTVTSVLGGFVGYGVGYKIGAPAARKMIPAKYLEKIEGYLRDNAKWAVFLAAVAPIPYKFVSISAGAFRVNLLVFVLISIVARGKRFLLPGAVIYFFGPSAQELLSKYSNDAMLATAIVLAVVGICYYFYRKHKRKQSLTVTE
jgi:undecaprenyl-diphosphatase